MALFVAHISDIAQSSTSHLVVVLAIAAFCVWLCLEHAFVKHQGLRPATLRRMLGSTLVVFVAAVVAPIPGLAQSTPQAQGLPDLISDPPAIAGTRFVRSPQGKILRVMVFDGFIHNIGTGKLEVSGNPQIDGGMKQRVFDGSEWTVVSTPTVQFDTTDGHNHFHLMRAMEYSLWSADRTTQVLDAAKVGFCLVDTEQMAAVYESNYLISDHNYCGVDDPDATELVMGITPGWRDTYDSNVSMQWVDIRETRPGLYWVAAVTDPHNEIVESNEDNNGIVFSEKIHAVDGYVALELAPQSPSSPIALRSRTYGTVGERAYVIAAGPEHGRLDLPTGVDLLDTTAVTYTPEPGFVGTDSFTYYAHDVTTPFPTNPQPVVVEVLVTASDSPGPAQTEPPPLTIAAPPAQSWPIYDPVQLTVELQESTEAETSWFAANLPAGLSIDAQTGVIQGSPTYPGNVESTVIAWADGARTERLMQWEITEAEVPALQTIPDLSSPVRNFLRHSLGSGTDGASYVATGLPQGISVTQNEPSVTGVARQTGDFHVVVDEVVDDRVVNSIEFEWTVRPSTQPAFPL